MNVRFLVQESSKPSPVFTLHQYDGIRFFQSCYPVGASQTYYYPESIEYSSSRICQIQLTGTMIEPTGVWPARTGEWISRADPFIIPQGTWSRITTEATELWCCLGRIDGEDLGYIYPVKLEVEKKLYLSKGQSLFIIKGEAECEGRSFGSTKRIRALSGNKELNITSNGYGFTWF